MPKRGGSPRGSYGRNLGVRQAMGDFFRATETDTRGSRVREKEGFLAARPDHYERVAEAIVDLLKADPIGGTREIARLLHLIEYAAWLKQDRLHETQPMNDEEFAEWVRHLVVRVDQQRGGKPTSAE